MYNVSELYTQELYSGARHRIRGLISMHNEIMALGDVNMKGGVRTEIRCTESENVFAIGQLYTGTVELTLISDTLRREELRGASIMLEFAAGSSEYIPLGSWTITDPQRTDEHTIAIRGADCISKLDVPITDNTVGNIKVAARMAMVRRLTGVEFAQTVAELTEMSGIDLENRFGSTFAPTCRAEVAYLAQLMGCIAYADRFGRIAFRKIGTSPVLTIPAELRHKASLCEYSYGIS